MPHLPSDQPFDPDKGRFSGQLTALVAAILPFLLLSYYNYPSIHDDYINANLINVYGRWGYVRHMYSTWTGRYTELLLKAYLHPLTYQQTSWLARLQPVVMMVLMVGGAGWLTWQLGRGAALRKAVIIGPLLLVALYLNGLDLPGSSLYWFGGYTAFTAGTVASLAAFACLLGLFRCHGSQRAQAGYWLGSAFFSVGAVGTYETCLVAICWVVGGATVWAWWQKLAIRWWLVALLLVVMGAACVAVFAPGNYVRAGQAGRDMPQLLTPLQLGRTWVVSMRFFLRKCLDWVLNPFLIPGILLLTGLWRQMRKAEAASPRLGHPVWLAVWLLIGLNAVIFPSFLIYQTVQPQTWQGVYLYCVLGAVWWLVAALDQYRPASTLFEKLTVGGGLPLQVGLCLWCFSAPISNTYLAYHEFFIEGPRHYRLVRQREVLLRRAAAVREPFVKGPIVELRPLYNKVQGAEMPRIGYSIEYNMDDARQYAHYYGVDQVNISTPLHVKGGY